MRLVATHRSRIMALSCHGSRLKAFMLPRAKKRLGQNFLVDETYARRIVGALAPRAGETVLEVGPGRGALTSMLVESGARVVAVEYARELAPLLRERFAARGQFTLAEADAPDVDSCSAV